MLGNPRGVDAVDSGTSSHIVVTQLSNLWVPTRACMSVRLVQTCMHACQSVCGYSDSVCVGGEVESDE